MTTTSVFDYETEMFKTVARVKRLCAEGLDTVGDETWLTPELAYAVLLCAPAHAFGLTDWYRSGARRSKRDDSDWARGVRLDWEAGHHHGGYHGYSFETIERYAEWIAGAAS